MIYDYSKLSGRIIEKCGSRENFAKKMKLSSRSVSLKLNNKVAFKQTEMQRAMKVLELSEDDIGPYFFNLKVQ